MGVSGGLASAIVACLLLASAIELVTCLLRFGFHLEATRDTAAFGTLTFGLRIHHGYVGLALMVLGLLLAWGRVLRYLLIAGAAFLVSDLFHHFLVLWLATGSPQFDLFY